VATIKGSGPGQHRMAVEMTASVRNSFMRKSGAPLSNFGNQAANMADGIPGSSKIEF
jgi:hypothetical protein